MELSKQEKSQIMRIISLIPLFRRRFNIVFHSKPEKMNAKKNRKEIDRGGFHQIV